MQTVQSPMTIADYCAAMGRGEIESNREYQRSDKVWPPAARSFLIETILLGFPLPKIYLFQKTDLKSKKTIKEIVDGQQRSKTILDFFNNNIAISRTSEIEAARGKKYDQLGDDLKGQFLNYLLSTDLFVAASTSEIRQAFRRLNSYTVPLNPEEMRHAEYQGPFKWFLYELSRDHEEILIQLGVLGEKQIVRMQDAKLFAEFVHAALNGIKTTKAKDLDTLYKQYEQHELPGQDDLRGRIDGAMDFIIGLPEIHNGPLMKPHIFYSLLLAISHTKCAMEKLREVCEPPEPYDFQRDIVVPNLTALAEALDSERPEQRFASFVDACSTKTNVDTQRKIRVRWLCDALQPNLL